MLLKIITGVVVVLGLVLHAGAPRAMALPVVSVDLPPPMVVAGGETFSLDVHITNVVDLFAFQFDLVFNPAVLAAVNVIEGSFLGGCGPAFCFFSLDNLDSITVIDTLTGPGPGATGSGLLATVDFLARAPGSSAVELANVLVLDSNLNPISAVPEPSTIVFLSTGLLGINGYSWRRWQQEASSPAGIVEGKTRRRERGR